MKIQTNWKDAPVPVLTETYSPVAHSELIYLITKKLEDRGYSVQGVAVQQNYNGEQIYGTMSLDRDSADGAFQQTLAFTNSYNNRLPIRLASGAKVFICANGMIIGDILSLRKHTGQVFPALKNLIDLAIDGMEESFERTQVDVHAMIAVDITVTQAAEIIGRMFVEEEILNSYEVNETVRQLRKPSFSDFEPSNLWSLYNHATYSLNNAAPDRRMPALKSLHIFFMDLVNELGIHV